jgi:hypothetical protein
MGRLNDLKNVRDGLAAKSNGMNIPAAEKLAYYMGATPAEYNQYVNSIPMSNKLFGGYGTSAQVGDAVTKQAIVNKDTIPIESIPEPIYTNLTKEDLLVNGVTKSMDAESIHKAQQEISQFKSIKDKEAMVSKLIDDGVIPAEGLSKYGITRDLEKEKQWTSY